MDFCTDVDLTQFLLLLVLVFFFNAILAELEIQSVIGFASAESIRPCTRERERERERENKKKKKKKRRQRHTTKREERARRRPHPHPRF
jgi:hypothetical protein